MAHARYVCACYSVHVFYVHVCACIYVHVCVCVCMYIRACVYVYMCVCVAEDVCAFCSVRNHSTARLGVPTNAYILLCDPTGGPVCSPSTHWWTNVFP